MIKSNVKVNSKIFASPNEALPLLLSVIERSSKEGEDIEKLAETKRKMEETLQQNPLYNSAEKKKEQKILSFLIKVMEKLLHFKKLLLRRCVVLSVASLALLSKSPPEKELLKQAEPRGLSLLSPVQCVLTAAEEKEDTALPASSLLIVFKDGSCSVFEAPITDEKKLFHLGAGEILRKFNINPNTENRLLAALEKELSSLAESRLMGHGFGTVSLPETILMAIAETGRQAEKKLALINSCYEPGFSL